MVAQDISAFVKKVARRAKFCICAVLTLLVGFGGCGQPSSPRVVVSIPPVHGLVSAIMQGADTPLLLMDGKNSPHTTALRPSQASALSRAELVIWVGPSLESGLRKAIDNRGDRLVLQLMEIEGLEIFSYSANDEHDHDAADVSEEAGHLDPHIWLMPGNAVHIIDAVVPALSELDPANAELYEENANALRQRIADVDLGLRKQLAPLSERRYAVLHNSLQYFGAAMGPDHAVVLKHRSDTPMGVASLLAAVDRISKSDISCLLVDPQHDADLATEIAKQTSLAIQLIDPMGSSIRPGPDHYVQTIEAVGDAFTECLSR